MALLLLADDEVHVGNIVRFKIEKEGHTLDYVANGEEAFDKLYNKAIKYDIIILDIMMPVYDGFEVLKKVKEIKGYKDTPVIMLTGKSKEKDISQCYDLGANEYIIKPFSPSDFHEKIKKYLI